MKNFAQNWLNIQSQSIDGLCSALFLLLNADQKDLKPAAQWPVDSTEPLELVAISKLAFERQENIINADIAQTATENKTFDYLASPIIIDKQLIGVVCVKTIHQNEQNQQKILHALTVGTKWLAMPSLTGNNSEHFHSTVMRLTLNCLQQDSLHKAFIALINELTREYNCERVSIGLLKRHHVEVIALSNAASFDNKSNLIRAISAAMDEAVDQDKVINFPQVEQDKKDITAAHNDLARQYGCDAICTIPMVYNESIFAVLSMERAKKNLFDQETINVCEQTLAIVSPFLKLKQDDELLLIQKLGKTSKNLLASLFGFQYIGYKLVFITSMIMLALSMLIEGDFRVHADAVLEGRIQRSISAPLSGFINLAKVRAGDTVIKGEIMAAMEDVELKLEKVKMTAEQQQLKREYREAMADRDLVQVRILNAQLAQISAKIQLNHEQLQRTVIRSPFDGVVINGDLSQLLGAPVDRGESLFTIAPLDGYRVILKVNERDIAFIKQGQQGNLALSSLPNRKFPLRIEKITHVASTDGGNNIFRVEANLSELPQQLRPGMEGVGKINIGRKKFFWIWTHEMVDWIKLWVWSWWP